MASPDHGAITVQPKKSAESASFSNTTRNSKPTTTLHNNEKGDTLSSSTTTTTPATTTTISSQGNAGASAAAAAVSSQGGGEDTPFMQQNKNDNNTLNHPQQQYPQQQQQQQQQQYKQIDAAVAAVEVLEFRGGTLAFRDRLVEASFQRQTSLRLSSMSFVWSSLPLILINFCLALGAFYQNGRFLLFFVAAGLVQMIWVALRPLVRSPFASAIINYVGCTAYMILMSTEGMILVRGNTNSSAAPLELSIYGQDSYQIELGIAIFVVLVPVTIFRVQLQWYRWAVATWLAYYLSMALVAYPVPKTMRSNLVIWLVLAATLSLVCAYRLELLVRMFWFFSSGEATHTNSSGEQSDEEDEESESDDEGEEADEDGSQSDSINNKNMKRRRRRRKERNQAAVEALARKSGFCTRMFVAMATGTCCNCCSSSSRRKNRKSKHHRSSSTMRNNNGDASSSEGNHSVLATGSNNTGEHVLLLGNLENNSSSSPSSSSPLSGATVIHSNKISPRRTGGSGFFDFFRFGGPDHHSPRGSSSSSSSTSNDTNNNNGNGGAASGKLSESSQQQQAAAASRAAVATAKLQASAKKCLELAQSLSNSSNNSSNNNKTNTKSATSSSSPPPLPHAAARVGAANALEVSQGEHHQNDTTKTLTLLTELLAAMPALVETEILLLSSENSNNYRQQGGNKSGGIFSTIRRRTSGGSAKSASTTSAGGGGNAGTAATQNGGTGLVALSLGHRAHNHNDNSSNNSITPNSGHSTGGSGHYHHHRRGSETGELVSPTSYDELSSQLDENTRQWVASEVLTNKKNRYSAISTNSVPGSVKSTTDKHSLARTIASIDSFVVRGGRVTTKDSSASTGVFAMSSIGGGGGAGGSTGGGGNYSGAIFTDELSASIKSVSTAHNHHHQQQNKFLNRAGSAVSLIATMPALFIPGAQVNVTAVSSGTPVTPIIPGGSGGGNDRRDTSHSAHSALSTSTTTGGGGGGAGSGSGARYDTLGSRQTLIFGSSTRLTTTGGVAGRGNGTGRNNTTTSSDNEMENDGDDDDHSDTLPVGPLPHGAFVATTTSSFSPSAVGASNATDALSPRRSSTDATTPNPRKGGAGGAPAAAATTGEGRRSSTDTHAPAASAGSSILTFFRRSSTGAAATANAATAAALASVTSNNATPSASTTPATVPTSPPSSSPVAPIVVGTSPTVPASGGAVIHMVVDSLTGASAPVKPAPAMSEGGGAINSTTTVATTIVTATTSTATATTATAATTTPASPQSSSSTTKYVNPKALVHMDMDLTTDQTQSAPDWLESRLSAIARLREIGAKSFSQADLLLQVRAQETVVASAMLSSSSSGSTALIAGLTGIISPDGTNAQTIIDFSHPNHQSSTYTPSSVVAENNNNNNNTNNNSSSIIDDTHHHQQQHNHHHQQQLTHTHSEDGLGSHRDIDVVERLRIVTQWDFDVFEFTNNSDGRPLAFISYELFSRFNFFPTSRTAGLGVSESAFTSFINKVEREYCFDPMQPNPYHTNVHAADVVQAVGAFLVVPRLTSILDQLDAFALIFAAIVHDFRHPGVNNNFLIKTSNPIAIRYNDDSVLENFHVAEAFGLMLQPKYDIFGSLTRDQRTSARFAAIKCVLATDLAKGATFTNAFKAKMTSPTMGETDEDKLLTMQMMIKCADVSHPARALRVHEEWSARISEEFYLQGDQERALGLPISPLCDRSAHNLGKSQIGFIEFVVKPAFMVLTTFCEVETWMDGLKANTKHWKDLVAMSDTLAIATISSAATIGASVTVAGAGGNMTGNNSSSNNYNNTSNAGTTVTAASNATVATNKSTSNLPSTFRSPPPSSMTSGGGTGGGHHHQQPPHHLNPHNNRAPMIAVLSDSYAQIPVQKNNSPTGSSTAAAPLIMSAVVASGGVGSIKPELSQSRRRSVSEGNIVATEAAKRSALALLHENAAAVVAAGGGGGSGNNGGGGDFSRHHRNHLHNRSGLSSIGRASKSANDLHGAADNDDSDGEDGSAGGGRKNTGDYSNMNSPVASFYNNNDKKNNHHHQGTNNSEDGVAAPVSGVDDSDEVTFVNDEADSDEEEDDSSGHQRGGRNAPSETSHNTTKATSGNEHHHHHHQNADSTSSIGSQVGPLPQFPSTSGGGPPGGAAGGVFSNPNLDATGVVTDGQPTTPHTLHSAPSKRQMTKRVSWRDDIDPSIMAAMMREGGGGNAAATIALPTHGSGGSPTTTSSNSTTTSGGGNSSPGGGGGLVSTTDSGSGNSTNYSSTGAYSPPVTHGNSYPGPIGTTTAGGTPLLNRTASERSLRQRFMVAVANSGGTLHLPTPVVLEVQIDGSSSSGEGGGSPTASSQPPRHQSMTISSLCTDDVAVLPLPLLIRIAAVAKLDTSRGF